MGRRSGGGPGLSCSALFFFDFGSCSARKRRNGESKFMECKHHMPLVQTVQQLGEVSSRAGLTEDQVVNLLAAGLEVEHVLEYVNAVLSHRVH